MRPLLDLWIDWMFRAGEAVSAVVVLIAGAMLCVGFMLADLITREQRI